MLSEAQFYRQQADRCEERLTKVTDPRRRHVIEQERGDWTELAGRATTLQAPKPMSLDDLPH